MDLKPGVNGESGKRAVHVLRVRPIYAMGRAPKKASWRGVIRKTSAGVSVTERLDVLVAVREVFQEEWFRCSLVS
jgi:hypothetical protein